MDVQKHVNFLLLVKFYFRNRLTLIYFFQFQLLIGRITHQNCRMSIPQRDVSSDIPLLHMDVTKNNMLELFSISKTVSHLNGGDVNFF